MRSRFPVALLLLLLSLPSLGYAPATHQRLTFIAAQQYNNCVAQLGLSSESLTPLQVRYMARMNVQQAQGNLLRRLVRWDYYNPDDRIRAVCCG